MLTKEQAELVWKWLIALRSGKYTQVKGVLVKTYGSPGYCCLGVLAKVAGYDDSDLSRYNTLEAESFPDLYSLLGSSKGSLKRDWPEMLDRITINLTVCNDKLGFNFNQIADVIQYNFYYDLKEHGYVD